MDVKDAEGYTPKQRRMLKFMADYLEIGTDELERRMVMDSLNELENVLGYFADAKNEVAKGKDDKKTSLVLEFPLGGDKD